MFDEYDMEIEYSRKRATSCKHNNNVILPGHLPPAQEQEIECKWVEWSEIFHDFMAEFTGVQKKQPDQWPDAEDNLQFLPENQRKSSKP